MINRDNYFDTLYRDDIPLMSQSMIKNALPINGGDIDKLDLAWYAQNESNETHAKKIGSLIHLFIEDPSNIVMMPEIEVSDTLKEITDIMYRAFEGENIDLMERSSLSVFHGICSDQKYGQSWKPETRVNKWLNNGGVDYYNALIDVDGKTIVTHNQYEAINGMSSSIITDDVFSDVFINPSDGLEVLTEVPVIFTHQDVRFKSLLDKVLINHDRKTCEVYDLKSTKNTPDKFEVGYTYVLEDGMIHKKWFNGDYATYKYYIQEYLYRKAALQLMIDMKNDSYEINFHFGVVENKAPFRTNMIHCNIGWMHIAQEEVNAGCEVVKRWIREGGFAEF